MSERYYLNEPFIDNYRGESTMITNINAFKVKEMDTLVVPLLDAYTLFDNDRGIKVISISPFAIFMSGGSERGEISGTIIDSQRMLVGMLGWGGSGSGSLFDQLKQLLSMSTGKLVVLLVWEDSSIEKMIVIDGHVSIEQIDI